MIYKFIDNNGTFTVENPNQYNLYFPLTNKDGTLLSSISPNLAGDIKKDNEHFLTPPASIEDLRSNLLCRRDFFIKTAPTTPSKKDIHGSRLRRASPEILRLSFLPTDILEAGFLYHKITKEAKSLRIEVLNFIPYDLPVEIMWVKVINKSRRHIKITPTSFIPLYGRSAQNLRDHRHVSSLLNRIHLHKYGIFLKPTLKFDEKGHKVNKTTYFCMGFENNGRSPLGQFPTLDYFYSNGDLLNPWAIEKDIKPAAKKQNGFDGKEALAAFRFRDKCLKGKEESNYFLIMGMTDDEKGKRKIMETFSKLNSPIKIKQSFTDTKKYWLKSNERINFDFKDKDFNNWLLWVKLQPTLRKLFGCSFLPHFDYGKGGRGWRDLWQDALSLLINEPLQAKGIMLNSFKGIRFDGTNATIITKRGKFISDRNSINRVWMDHGVWPYLTLHSYIDKTGDCNILNKPLPYFRDHLLNRAREIDYVFNQADNFLRTRHGKVYEGSVLEHILVQSLTSFFNVGKHNVIRLENGDWNDGLDMAAEQGESVSFSFMYAYALGDLCFFLEKLKEKRKKVKLAKELQLLLDKTKNSINYSDFKEKQKRLRLYFKQIRNISGRTFEVNIDDLIYDLKEKSKHIFGTLQKKEWLSCGFFNGYYDNKGKRVEGKFKGKTRIMLTSQVFAIMSGAASNSQIKKIWASINKHLWDKKFGGFRLNTNFESPCLDLGRAFSFSYGDKENGAFFNHMAVMLAYALYSRGFVKEAQSVMESIYKMATSSCAKILPMIPEYFNNKGEGLYSYLTGSASWYIHTLINRCGPFILKKG